MSDPATAPTPPGSGAEPGGTDDDLATQVEDAMVDGDRTLTPGSARAAFVHRDFRIIYFGAFA